MLLVPFGDGWYRAIAWDRSREQAPLDEPVTEAEIRSAFDKIAGEDFGMTEMRWSSRFLSERKQARRYRVGRVFIAGDAAHVHSPLGGQGMNTGIGDAVNLGWKLAEAVRGTAPAGLLDTYQSERHPVGTRVLQMTDAFNKLVLGTSAIRQLIRRVAITAILALPVGRRTMGGLLSGIGIKYAARRARTSWSGGGCPTSTAALSGCSSCCGRVASCCSPGPPDRRRAVGCGVWCARRSEPARGDPDSPRRLRRMGVRPGARRGDDPYCAESVDDDR